MSRISGIGGGRAAAWILLGGVFFGLSHTGTELNGDPGPFQLFRTTSTDQKQEFVGRGELSAVQKNKDRVRILVFERRSMRGWPDARVVQYFGKDRSLLYLRDRLGHEAGTFQVADVVLERDQPEAPRRVILFGTVALKSDSDRRYLSLGYRAGYYQRERSYRPPVRFAPEPRKTLREIRHAVDRKLMTYVPAVELRGSDRTQIRFPSYDYAVFGQGDDPALDNFNPHFYSRDQKIIPRIHAFYMDKYEVTNAEYLRFCHRAGHPLPPAWQARGSFPPGKGDHPVTVASFRDAEAYARYTGKRLPTEVEWELAARGGLAALADFSGGNPESIRHSPPVFPFGNKFDANRCNTLESGHGGTLPVTRMRDRSPYGLIGMCGNAGEWTSSWYNPYPGNRFRDRHLIGRQFKVIRGGSFRQNQASARADARDYGGFPNLRDDRSAGFRLVLPVIKKL